MAQNTDDIVDEFEIDDVVGSNSSGFSGAKIGRFIAVALFLLLGTFAVIHSMTRPHKPHAGPDHGEGMGTSLAAAGSELAGKTDNAISSLKESTSAAINGAKGKYGNIVAAGRNAADKFAKAAPSPSKFPSSTFPKPKPSASVAKAAAPPTTRTFKPSPLPQPLRTKNPKPPTRFAAAPGKPLIGSQGGFGELKKPVQPAAISNRFAAPKVVEPTASAASSLIRKSGNEAKQLLGNLAKAPEVIRGKAAGAVDSASSSLTSRATNAFGSQKPPNRSFGAPAPKASTNRFAQPKAAPPAQPSRTNSAFAGLPKPNTAAAPASASRFPSNLRPLSAQQPKSASSLKPAPTNTIPRPSRRTLASTVARPVAGTRQAGALPVPGDRRLDGVQAPSLSIEKLSPKEIQVGEPADFQILIRNVGRIAVDEIRVFDQIPVGTEFISASPNPTQADKRNLSWDIGTLAPGVEKRINVQLKPTRPGEIGSVAQYTFAARSSMRTRVTQPVLEITHRCEPKVLIGGQILLDVVVTNKGDGPAKDVLIQEDVPAQLKFREGYREIEYEVGTLQPNQSRNVRLALQALKPGKLENIIHATGSGGLKSQHKLNLEVIAPQLQTKSAGPNVRFLGRNAKHTFSVANRGTASATNVNLIARLPSGLRYVQSNNKGTYNRNMHAVLWELAELNQGVDASVEVMTEPISIGNQPIKFEATADLNMRDVTEQPLMVEHLVDVFIDIDDVLDPIEIGSETSYRVEVVNQGTKVATNVQLQASFPNGLKPTSVDGPLANQIRGQQIVFSPIESLKPGAKLSFVISGQGVAAGDHRVVLKMTTDGRTTAVSKEESTRVYSDR